METSVSLLYSASELTHLGRWGQLVLFQTEESSYGDILEFPREFSFGLKKKKMGGKRTGAEGSDGEGWGIGEIARLRHICSGMETV